METQKTPDSQSNLEKEERSWKNQYPQHQTILSNQICSNQNSRVLAQKQAHRSMEQDRKPRNKPAHLWSINLTSKEARIQWRKDGLFGKYFWENWKATCKRIKLKHSLTPYKNKINLLGLRPTTVKLLEENISRTLFDIN